jgi:hypothetical protein
LPLPQKGCKKGRKRGLLNRARGSLAGLRRFSHSMFRKKEKADFFGLFRSLKIGHCSSSMAL